MVCATECSTQNNNMTAASGPAVKRLMAYLALRRLFPSERVLDAADRILNLALYLVGLALRFQLGVTDRFAGCLLDGAPLTSFADPATRSLSMISSSKP